MGCSQSINIDRSSVEPETKAVTAVVLLIPESLALTPSRAKEPTFDTHQRYVQKLDRYLVDVLKHPNAFQSRVEVRLEASLGRSGLVGIQVR